MWRPWSRLLEALGRVRFSARSTWRVSVGDPRAVDARGGSEWRAFLAPEDLFRVWGPLDGSPWEPFHCVPLFAALDRVARGRAGPPSKVELERAASGPDVLPGHARPGAPAPAWATPGTWTIVDLPGPVAVEAGAWLVTAAGCQPVCTFDHWPHPRGVLRAEAILAELLRWASTVGAARGRLVRDAPPVWICDSERLGTRTGSPGEFDNRYFLDDSILPGPGLLGGAGIRRVVYLSAGSGSRTGGAAPAVPVVDLEAYLSDLLKAGLPVLHVEVSEFSLEPRPFSAPSSPRPPPRSGYRRSAAGGFGTEVPEPSSSSSG